METNIIEIVKKLRYYEIALNELTTSQQRVQFKAQSRYKCISLEELERADDQTSVASQNSLENLQDMELNELSKSKYIVRIYAAEMGEDLTQSAQEESQTLTHLQSSVFIS